MAVATIRINTVFNMNMECFFSRKPDEDSEDEGKAWNEKNGESHLEVKAYGFKTIYYVVSGANEEAYFDRWMDGWMDG